MGGEKVAVLLGNQLLVFAPATSTNFLSFMALPPSGAAVASTPHFAPILTAVSFMPLATTAEGAFDESTLAIADACGWLHIAAKVEGTNQLVTQRRIAAPPPVTPGSYIGAAHFNTRASSLAVGTSYGAIALMDTRAPRAEQCRIVAAHSGEPICAVQFSADGSLLASGGNDNQVLIWSTAMLREPVAVVHHTAAVRALSWCPTLQGILATGGGSTDCSIRISNTHLPATQPQRPGFAESAVLASRQTTAQITQIDWSADGKYLVSAHGFHRDSLMQPHTAPPVTPCAMSIGENSLAVWSFSPTSTRSTSEALRALLPNTERNLLAKDVPCSYSGEAENGENYEVRLVSELTGHTARPLHLAQQKGSGHSYCNRGGVGRFVSAAAGKDATLPLLGPFLMSTSKKPAKSERSVTSNKAARSLCEVASNLTYTPTFLRI